MGPLDKIKSLESSCWHSAVGSELSLSFSDGMSQKGRSRDKTMDCAVSKNNDYSQPDIAGRT